MIYAKNQHFCGTFILFCGSIFVILQNTFTFVWNISIVLWDNFTIKKIDLLLFMEHFYFCGKYLRCFYGTFSFVEQFLSFSWNIMTFLWDIHTIFMKHYWALMEQVSVPFKSIFVKLLNLTENNNPIYHFHQELILQRYKPWVTLNFTSHLDISCKQGMTNCDP